MRRIQERSEADYEWFKRALVNPEYQEWAMVMRHDEELSDLREEVIELRKLVERLRDKC